MCDARSRLTKKAEPPPTRGVNRDSGTASANGGWLRRLVRQHIVKTHNVLGVSSKSASRSFAYNCSPIWAESSGGKSNPNFSENTAETTLAASETDRISSMRRAIAPLSMSYSFDGAPFLRNPYKSQASMTELTARMTASKLCGVSMLPNGSELNCTGTLAHESLRLFLSSF